MTGAVPFIEAGDTDAVADVAAAAAADLCLIARLHDREPDATLVGALAEQPATDWLALRLDGDGLATGLALMSRALDELGRPPSPTDLDRLAAAYADIYLTHGLRLAPNGSVWLTEDRLERQEPMFEVRRWYAHHGIAAPDWRVRADDHLVHELQFVARLIGEGNFPEAAQFLDAHLLRWLPLFCAGVAQRSPEAFFAGLALVTGAYVDALRGLLVGIGAGRRTLPDAPPEQAAAPIEPAAYAVGLAPSW